MISIVIINYNTFELTCACIRSIIEKTESDHEIILVDNGSKECDPDQFLTIFDNITLIKSENNVGFAKGNNLGIEAAKGDYILLLNSDTVLINNAIDLAYQKLKSDSQLGVISSQLVSVDGSLQQASFEITPMYKLVACSFKLHKIIPSFTPYAKNLTVEHQTNYLWGTFFFFKKEVLNGFPNHKLSETYFMYLEDLEWCYYIKKAGFKLLYFPEAKVLHYGAASSTTKSTSSKWINATNNEYDFLRMVNGKLYVTFYFFSKALFQVSNFNKELLPYAKYFVKMAIKNFWSYTYNYEVYHSK